MPTKNPAINFVIGFMLIVLSALVVYFGYSTFFVVFPLPPNAKEFQSAITGGMSSISAFASAFFLFLLNRPKEKVRESGPEPEMPAVERNRTDPKLLASTDEQLAHHVQRHAAYKDAYLKQRAMITEQARILKSALASAEQNALRSRRYLLHRSVFVVATLFSIWQLISGFIGTAIYNHFAAVYPQGNVPWPALFGQSILMFAMTPIIAGWSVAHFRRVCGGLSIRCAVGIGCGGILLSGMVFFLNLSPESIPSLMDATTPIVFQNGTRMPLLVWLMAMRVLILPLSGLVGVVWIMLWNAPDESKRLPIAPEPIPAGYGLATN